METTTIIAVSTIVIGVVLLFLLNESLESLNPNEGCISEDWSGQPVNIFLPLLNCHTHHVNRPWTSYYDPRFKAYIILPNEWGPPEYRDKDTLLWKSEHVDRTTTYEESASDNIDGKIFIGLFPFRRRHFYTISYTKVREKGYVLKTGETLMYENKSRKVIMVADSLTNHFRLFTEMGVVILDKETGGAPGETYKGLEDIKVNGAYSAAVHIINVFKYLSTTQNGFFRILGQKIEGIIKQVVGSTNYKGLIRAKDESGEEGTVSALIHTINIDTTASGGSPSFIEMYGGGVYDVTNLDIDASEESKKLIDSIDREFIASQDAKVAKLRGQGMGDEYAAYVTEVTKVDKKYVTEVWGAKNILLRQRGPHPDIRALMVAKIAAGKNALVYAPREESLLNFASNVDSNFGEIPNFMKNLHPEKIEVIKEVIIEKSVEEENNSENNSVENSDSTDNSNNNSNQNNNNQNNNSGNNRKNNSRNNNRNNNRNRNGKGGGKGGNNSQNKGNNNNK